MRSTRAIVVVLALGFLVPALAQGAIVQYNDRAAWLAAIGGTPDAQEDFQGFAVDTLFRAAPVTIAIGTIGQAGLDQAFRNQVDAPPFEFTDNNGTTHASCFVNFPDAGAGSETNVEIVFSQPVTAWGGDFNGVLGGELLAVDVDGSQEVILGTLLPAAQDTFLGFVADAGEQIDLVIFRSQNQNPGGGGEGFGADNFAVLWAGAQAGASVSGAKTVSGDFWPGGAITYRVVLTNAGPGDQGDNSGDELVDVLPAEVTLTGASASSGTAAADLGTNTVTWNGPIPAGGSVTVQISALVGSAPVGTVVSNQGTVAYDGDGNGSNETQVPTDDPGLPGADDPTSFTVIEQQAIPTLGNLGLLLLVGMLAGAGVVLLRWRLAG
jgi:uncharacterized repeat protein (TIGR01451 family)